MAVSLKDYADTMGELSPRGGITKIARHQANHLVRCIGHFSTDRIKEHFNPTLRDAARVEQRCHDDCLHQ
jgi:hypothetical protein